MASVRYWLWLSLKEKIRKPRLLAALRWFGDPELVYRADEKSLRYVEALTDSDVAALTDKSTEAADKTAEVCLEKGISIITLQDAAYPPLLKNIDDPPVLLYVMGTMPDMDGEIPVAMVGSRKSSVYGQLAAKRLGYQITRCGGLVVSGMAEGIDAMAHQGALLAGGRTVAVLGCGVDVIYPKSNKNLYGDIIQNGAVISEYPPGTPPTGDHFPVRNRIISGMSYGALVVECPVKSGALITARNALEQGRDVFAVPGNIDNFACEGSNGLIRDGAGLVGKGWDIMSEYVHLRPEKVAYKADAVEIKIDTVSTHIRGENGDKLPEKSMKNKTASETLDKKVIDKEPDKAYIQRLEELGPDAVAIGEALGDKTRHIDDIIDLTQMKTARVLATLTLMEIKGLVTQLPGKRFKIS